MPHAEEAANKGDGPEVDMDAYLIFQANSCLVGRRAASYGTGDT